MKFRRKSTTGDAESPEVASSEAPQVEASPGPYDADDLPEDGVERVDLGSLLIAPEEGRELRRAISTASDDDWTTDADRPTT